jgi:hypothetical protein
MNQSNNNTVDTLIDVLLADDRSPHFAIGYLGNMIRRYMEADDSVDDNVKTHIEYLKESI